MPWFALVTWVSLLHFPLADDAAKTDAREALRTFNELVGPWRGTGEPLTGDRSKGGWKETISWGWKFKGPEAWIVLDIKNGKHFKGGEVHYRAGDQKYEVILDTKEGKRLQFLGELTKNGRSLVAERTDDEAQEVQRLSINLVGEIRFVYLLEKRPISRKQFTRVFQVAATKEGESLGVAAKSNKPECVVSGGLGTMTVSHKGVTYYVCCTGCLEAFKDDPEKYIKEFEEKKRKGK